MPTATHTQAGTTFIPSRPTLASQPSRMAAIAALRGVTPPALAGATVVEFGCADGTNALAIAAAHPELTVLGVDASPVALERANALLEGAPLENASLAPGTAAPPSRTTRWTPG